MSNSLAINDSSNKFGTAQKMSFTQTCNLLSQFVKENRAFGIPTAATTTTLDAPSGEGYNPSTMNLFPVKQAETPIASVGHTVNLFPQISGFNSSMNKRASPEPPTAQMTIFYGGQVVVFNDLPADKATDVMNMASRFESSLKMRKVETHGGPVLVATEKPNDNQKPNPNPNPNPIENHVTAVAAAVPRASVPITRKASLHRFLEKRKDRLVGKASSIGNAADGVATKPLEANAWLGLN
ncbi:protein TIFY 10A-like [Silene latifolia]|uniref:protein TIFY 10A-like n=1 Tax=Silene latifolia TaxID=37657 RepID=UPI003D784A87